MENHKQVFLIGDLNFRIKELDREEVIGACQDNNLDSLVDKDTLVVEFDKYRFSNLSSCSD